jgi:hypothetical protein
MKVRTRFQFCYVRVMSRGKKKWGAVPGWKIAERRKVAELPVFERWIVVRRKYWLSNAEICMARAIGLGPTMIMAKMDLQEAKGRSLEQRLRWLRRMIHSCYRRRFGKVLDYTPKIERIRSETKRKHRQERRQKQRAKEAAAVPPGCTS